MKNEAYYRRLANMSLLMFSFVFLQTMVAVFGLWRAGGYWEQAKWSAGEVAFTSFCFFVAGTVNLVKLRKALPSGVVADAA